MGKTRKAIRAANTAVKGLEQSFELTAFLAHMILDHHVTMRPTETHPPELVETCCYCGSSALDPNVEYKSLVHEGNCPVPIAWEVRGLADELTAYEKTLATKGNVDALREAMKEAKEEEAEDA